MQQQSQKVNFKPLVQRLKENRGLLLIQQQSQKVIFEPLVHRLKERRGLLQCNDSKKIGVVATAATDNENWFASATNQIWYKGLQIYKNNMHSPFLLERGNACYFCKFVNSLVEFGRKLKNIDTLATGLGGEEWEKL